jgi:hypothetical protein
LQGLKAGDALAEVIKGTVKVVRGTGVFSGASGGGTMTALVRSNGEFSSWTDVILVIEGEK